MAKPYPSATWTPQQVHDFVPFLRGAFERAGVTGTKIMIAEESTWGSFTYARETMNDPGTASAIGILAAHNYDHGNPMSPPIFRNFTTQHVWQTEVSGFEKYDGGIGNALYWAQRIHHFLSDARVSAFHYWYLSAVPNRRTSDEALTNADDHIPLRTYAMANWSTFVGPRWHTVSGTTRT